MPFPIHISRSVQVLTQTWDAHGSIDWFPDMPGWQQPQWHMATYRWPEVDDVPSDRASWYFAVGWGPDSAGIWCGAYGRGGSPFGGEPFYHRKGVGAWTEEEGRVAEGVRVLLENLELYRAAHAAQGWPGESWFAWHRRTNPWAYTYDPEAAERYRIESEREAAQYAADRAAKRRW